MLQSIDVWARGWVGDLADVLVALGDRLSGGRHYVVRPAEDGYRLFRRGAASPEGAIGLAGGVLTTTPARLADRIKGASVEIEVPPSWVFERRLEPVAAQSAPYLDAFVSHQIERVTPWRTADTYFGVMTAPLAEDPGRLTVSVGVVPRSLVGGLVEPLARLEPRRLSIVTAAEDGRFVIPLASEDARRRQRVGRLVGTVAAALVVATVAILGAGAWVAAAIEAESAEIDEQVAARKAFLQQAADRTRPRSDPAEALRAMRAAAVPVVVLLDALAEALPDQAHVTELRIEKDKIRLSGVAQEVSALIPPLEASPRFRAVAFFAPSTRLPSGGGDRFHVEMTLEPAASGGER